MKGKKSTTKEKHLTKIMLEHASLVASEIKAKALLVNVQNKDDFKAISDQIKKLKPVIVVRSEELYHELSEQEGAKLLKVPDVTLTRMGQGKVAIMYALSSDYISPGDKIVCLTGVSKFGADDTLVVVDTDREFEIFSSDTFIDADSVVRPDIFETVLNLAIELATQGREGKAVGTIFVIGDDEKVLQLSRQLVINPFKGYSEQELSIHDTQLRETIKEFSVIDGAFIIRGDGVLVTAGRHLNAALEGGDLPQGLGSRHVAAAGITSLTDAIAIVISESTGSVRIFKEGRVFMEIERPSMKS
jgi:DNA integrity scanning protein DisA with diadenylate cyclase activity